MTERIGQQPVGAVTGGLSGHSLDDPLLARFVVKCLRSRYTGGRSLFKYSRLVANRRRSLGFDPSRLTIAVQKATVVSRASSLPALSGLLN